MPVDKPIMRPKKMMRTAVPSVAQENIDDFDEDILTKPLNIMEGKELFYWAIRHS